MDSSLVTGTFFMMREPETQPRTAPRREITPQMLALPLLCSCQDRKMTPQAPVIMPMHCGRFGGFSPAKRKAPISMKMGVELMMTAVATEVTMVWPRTSRPPEATTSKTANRECIPQSLGEILRQEPLLSLAQASMSMPARMLRTPQTTKGPATSRLSLLPR